MLFSCKERLECSVSMKECQGVTRLERRHHEALEHAQAAVVLLQEELSQMEMNGEHHENRSPETLNKMAVLAISYHNIGASFYSLVPSTIVLSVCFLADNIAFIHEQVWKRSI